MPPGVHKLEAAGQRFVTETDTEVVAHLVKEAMRGGLAPRVGAPRSGGGFGHTGQNKFEARNSKAPGGGALLEYLNPNFQNSKLIFGNHNSNLHLF